MPGRTPGSPAASAINARTVFHLRRSPPVPFRGSSPLIELASLPPISRPGRDGPLQFRTCRCFRARAYTPPERALVLTRHQIRGFWLLPRWDSTIPLNTPSFSGRTIKADPRSSSKAREDRSPASARPAGRMPRVRSLPPDCRCEQRSRRCRLESVAQAFTRGSAFFSPLGSCARRPSLRRGPPITPG